MSDADEDLTDGERAVLAYAAEQATKRGIFRVTIPVRDFDAAGIRKSTVHRLLKALTDKGLLSLAVRGQAAGSIENRRANIYELPSMYRGTRSMSQPDQIYVPRPDEAPYVPPARSMSHEDQSTSVTAEPAFGLAINGTGPSEGSPPVDLNGLSRLRRGDPASIATVRALLVELTGNQQLLEAEGGAM